MSRGCNAVITTVSLEKRAVGVFASGQGSNFEVGLLARYSGHVRPSIPRPRSSDTKDCFDSEKENVCNICLEVVNHLGTLTKCKHMFCKSCLDQWKETQFQRIYKTTCPICCQSLLFNMTIIEEGWVEQPYGRTPNEDPCEWKLRTFRRRWRQFRMRPHRLKHNSWKK